MSNSLFFAVAVFGMGVMLGLDALVAKSYGAGRLDDCVRWLQHGVLVALIVAPTIMLIFYGALTTSAHWGLHPAVRAQAQPYMAILGLGAPPLLLYATFRRYLQGMHAVRPVMAALVSANLVNAFGNWVLIWGHFGLPALGINGSAWATVGARVYMAAFLGFAIAREHRKRGGRPPPNPLRLRRGARAAASGARSAGRLTGDAGGGRLRRGERDGRNARSRLAWRASDCAEHRGAGIHGAAGPVVGGRRSRRPCRRRRGPAPRRSGRLDRIRRRRTITGIVGLSFIVAPMPMLRAFTDDPQLLSIGARLLSIAAAFQLFDGTQAVATGVLRGVGDTRTPMVINVIGHWVFGLPVGWALCFRYGWGVIGLWVGLSIGLIFVAVVLTVAWHWKSRNLVLPVTPALVAP